MSATAERLVELADVAVQANGERFTHIEGRVAPYYEWGMRAGYLERFAAGAFTASVARHPKVPLLLFHDVESMGVGVAEAWDDQADGLWCRFKLAHTAVAQEAAHHARDEMLGGLSVGYIVEPGHSDWTYHPEWNPEIGNLDQVTRTRVRLAEVSMTPTPMFEGAYISQVYAEAVDSDARPALAAAKAWLRADRYQHQRALAAARGR